MKKCFIQTLVKEKLNVTLGHKNFNNSEIISENESLDRLPKQIKKEFLKCATCLENKIPKSPFHYNRRRAEDIRD